jgi:hypothetical protein
MAVADGIDDIMVRIEVSKGAHAMVTTPDEILDIDAQGKVIKSDRMPETTSRPSWRQMQ